MSTLCPKCTSNDLQSSVVRNKPSFNYSIQDKNQEWISIEWREFLHPGDCELLKRIMKLANTYHKIVEFQELVANRQTIQDKSIVQTSEDGDNNQEEIKYGLYLKAFCNGLDEALEDYTNEIIKLEQTVLLNPQITLAYVVSSIEKYSSLFEALKAMIRTVKFEHISGCLLIGRLHMYTRCGITQIADAANKIVRSINTMFYRHLANWIVYGDLVDVYNEFFIEDCKCDDDNFLFPEQIEAGQGELDTSSSIMKKSRVRKPWKIHKFIIKTAMLPSTLPLETAETILFIGRTVWILQNDPNRNYDVLQEKFKRDVWEGGSEECHRKILNLEQHSFDLQLLQRTINECRLRLTKYLWKVMVEEAQLLEHLQLIRDYYALGRGELFQQFIVVADEQLRQTTNVYMVKNLNVIFNETARKMYTENDRSYQKFELSLPRNLEDYNTDSPLLNLELYLDINWPLHIIFHPKVISLYNKLFGFLLRVKKTHIGLHMVWLNHMVGKKKMDRGVWTLRHNLMFLVNNIQFYLQVDVIEAQFSLLKEAVRNANEFNDIIRLHSTFLSNLLSKTFVMVVGEQPDEETRHNLYQLPNLKFESKNMVYKIILVLLELCDEFCVWASTWDSELTEVELNGLEELQKRSDIIIETLLRELYSLHKQVSGSHLLQLLHRIDFNRWYTLSKPDLNITVS